MDTKTKHKVTRIDVYNQRMKKKENWKCDCRGHKELISPNDCMCSPHDADDLSKCGSRFWDSFLTLIDKHTKEGKEEIIKKIKKELMNWDWMRESDPIEIEDYLDEVLSDIRTKVK